MILRHKPETIGLQLDENGWVKTKDLIEKLNSNGFRITEEALYHIVETNNKKRFSFNEDKSRIRANQGHSLPVNLDLRDSDPPSFLYHGTGERSVGSIVENGIQKRNRQHVHLSSDVETALTVGSRHGKPKVFRVEAGLMKIEGYSFFLSNNNVWLVDYVPASYLKLLEI